MSIDQNKALVAAACRHLNDRNLDALFAGFHEEGSWTLPFRADRFAFAGCHSKQGMRELLDGFLGGFRRFSFDILGMIAEDDRVFVQGRSEGEGPGEARYANTYHLLFIIKDGMVHTVREFFDPYEVDAYIAGFPQES